MTRSSRSEPPSAHARRGREALRATRGSTPAPRATPDARRRDGDWHDSGWTRLLALPIALVAATLVHGAAVRTFFAQDDVTFLSRARDLVPTPWSMARPLFEVEWRLLNAMFGLHPLPDHLVVFGLHLANVALVYLIGLRLLRSRLAALAAAILFGVSPVAFTPLHWTSGLIEVSVTGFALAAFWMWLAGRDRGSKAWLVAGALCGLLALLIKESSILLPVVMVVAHLRLEPRARAGGSATSGATHPTGAAPTSGAAPRAAGWASLVPQLAVTALYAIAFVATLKRVHYVGSEAYAMTASPVFLALNFATYLSWMVSPVPVPDAIAAMDPSAWPVGLAVAAAIAAVLWWQRRAPRHPEEVAVAWFVCFLLPVVPLEHHTYLYYLYLALPGACWLLARVGRRAVRVLGERLPGLAPVTRAAAVALLVAVVAVAFLQNRARAHAMQGNFPLDKTRREAMLLGNAIHDLREARLPPGTRIAFVNPAPRQHVSLVDTTTVNRATIGSYVPLEGALRNGEAIRLFFPGIEYLGFADHLPREWEDAEVFLFQDEGHLRALGKGGHALAQLGYFLLPIHDWPRAEAMLLRSRALGDTLADATFGLIITRDFLGDRAGSDTFAREFLRRWPHDPRTKTILEGGSTIPP